MGAFVCFSASLLGAFGAAIWASLRAADEAAGAEARWGEVVCSDDVHGDGAFREARLLEHRPRGVPRLVARTGAFGVALGILSTVIVGPMSLLLALFTGTETDAGSLLTVATVAVAGMSFVSGSLVYGASRGVLRCEREGGRRAVVAGRIELALHALPIALYCVTLGPTSGPTLVAFALWSLGAIHGALLLAAGARVAAIQASMSDDELAALPRRALPVRVGRHLRSVARAAER